MDEKSVLSRIHDLVEEEHSLRAAVQSGALASDDERSRLRAVEEALDQAWDLLRRRRAAVDSDQNPDALGPRPVSEVEGYLQ
jgi:C4-dicarboxylate-specific signal transduction histidine kinase